MIYFRPHVQALESQIAYLKERLAKAEQEKREAEEAARLREDALSDRLAKAEEVARVRTDALLDRVLVKANVAPVAESLTPAPPSPDILTPYNAMGPEVQEAYRESWLKEEVEWLMREDPTIDEGIARALAEQNYVLKHQVIK